MTERLTADLRPKTHLRHEIKFLLNRTQHLALAGAVNQMLQPDPFGDDDGRYTVTSLYYDTADYKAYWDKVNGVKMRRKVRVRTYGNPVVTPETMVYLEIKQRTNVRIGKRRLRLPYSVAANFGDYAAELPNLTLSEQRTAAELHYLFDALHLQPTCVVSYHRAAYGNHADYPDLRITFDTDVRGRVENLSLLTADAGPLQMVLAPGWSILEVKVNQTIPYWLAQLLSRHGCTPRRISKYCAALERCEAIRRRQHIEMLKQ